MLASTNNHFLLRNWWFTFRYWLSYFVDFCWIPVAPSLPSCRFYVEVVSSGGVLCEQAEVMLTDPSWVPRPHAEQRKGRWYLGPGIALLSTVDDRRSSRYGQHRLYNLLYWFVCCSSVAICSVRCSRGKISLPFFHLVSSNWLRYRNNAQRWFDLLPCRQYSIDGIKCRITLWCPSMWVLYSRSCGMSNMLAASATTLDPTN